MWNCLPKQWGHNQVIQHGRINPKSNKQTDNQPCNSTRGFSRDYSLDCLCRHLIPTVIKASGSSKTWDCLPKQWGRDQGNNDASQLHQPFNGHVLFRWQLLSKRRRRQRHADANMTPLRRYGDAALTLRSAADAAPPTPRRLTSLIMSTYSLYDAALHTLEFDGKFPHRHVRITVNLFLDGCLKCQRLPSFSMHDVCGTSNPSLQV